MNFLASILTGPSGKPSAMRAVTIYVPVVIVTVWAYVSVCKQELQPLTDFQVAAILGPMAAKYFQRKAEGEKKEETK